MPWPDGPAGVLVGWAIVAAAALVWEWQMAWPQDDHWTKRLAEEEGFLGQAAGSCRQGCR